jgi:aryl-alcohol dehydrogenase-like predicted oxidoreductase
MGLSGVYNAPVDPAAAVTLLQEAIDLGVEHFDTAEVYGLTKNEELLGAAFHDRRNKVFIATKWGPLSISPPASAGRSTARRRIAAAPSKAR